MEVLLPAPKHYSPFVGFRTGLSEPEWLALSDIQPKEAFYELRGSGENARPRKPETCPDVHNEPTLEPLQLPVRLMDKTDFDALPTFYM